MIDRASYASTAVLCLLLAIGCGRADRSDATAAAPAGTADEDSVFAYVQRIDAAHLKDAFAAADDRDHQRYERTEQYDADGFRIAFEERTIRRSGSDERIVARDAAGTFDFGYLSRFVSEADEQRNPAEMAAYAVPDDPAYRSDRTREAYAYRMSADTLIGGVEVNVVEIAAHPEIGRDQTIRRARLYAERGSDRLVALYVERRDVALWFREESALFLSIRPTDSGDWVPHHTRYETLIRMPFRPSQRFRTVATFYGYGPAV